MNYLWEENNLQSLYSDLKETLPNQPLVRARLIDGLSNHCGEKPLVFHFFGKAENYVELVTRLISKNLLGSEKNERLLVFNHTDHLQKRIYENIAYWEQPTLVVIYFNETNYFEGLDFLTGAFNDNGASISWSRFTPISIKLCTFIIVSNVIDSTEIQFFRGPSIHELERVVKERLTQQKWSTELLDSFKYIPFV